eukprot:8581849-Alexandrium_andersonii.AAC.1
MHKVACRMLRLHVRTRAALGCSCACTAAPCKIVFGSSALCISIHRFASVARALPSGSKCARASVKVGAASSWSASTTRTPTARASSPR